MATSHGTSRTGGPFIFILALSSFLLIVTANIATAEDLLDDLYYQTSNGKWLIALGSIVISMLSIMVAVRYFKLTPNKWMVPIVIFMELIIFICTAIVPWREGLGLIALFAVASYFSLRYKERIKGIKRVLR